ncbi:MAG: glycoside hydrolase family 65 protein [Ilumatobacteraceae bacterium]
MDLSDARLDPDRYPTDPWRLVEVDYRPEELGRNETLFSVANGYVGLRGNLEEGRDAHQHGTFINGFHETWEIKHAEDAFGFARVGQTIVNVPDAKLIKLYVDDEPLLLTYGDLYDYERSLDFRDGTLRRTLVWRTPSGKRVRVTSSRMVSFEHRHLALMTFEVEMLDGSAPVVISSQLLNRQDGEDEYHVPSAALGEGQDPRQAEKFEHRVLQPQLQRRSGERVVLGYRCANSGMTLACSFHHVVSSDAEVRISTEARPDVAKTVINGALGEGQKLTLTKYVAYHSSRGVPSSELADRCERTLDRAMNAGVEALRDQQRAWLDEYWSRSDAEIEGRPELQQALRWNLFHLAQATGRTQEGVAAKGLTGDGYGGHFFWDTEIYVMPFLTYTAPRVARSLLHFRYRMLDYARRRARELNQVGALYPWRTISGEEASAYYAAGTAQYHINADVIYALDQYVRISGDREFLFHEGAEMFVETARLWEDLGFYELGSEERFHIHGVTGPDEYTTVVNDNLFTNVMARFNLRRAAEVLHELDEVDGTQHRLLVKRVGLRDGEIEAWRRAAEAMHVPYDERQGIHPQDAVPRSRALICPARPSGRCCCTTTRW